MDTSIFYAYIILTFFISVLITINSRTENPFFTFIFCYWIFAGSLLETEFFIINIRSFSFDVQPSRLLFIIFLLYFITSIRRYKKHEAEVNKRPTYEIFLYIFLGLYLLVNIIHLTDVMTMRELIAGYIKMLNFLMIYLVIKRTGDRGMFRAITNSLIIVGILSSLVGIYQFAVDPEFFRYGPQFRAFSDYLRSNGVFKAEYYQSYFLIVASLATLFRIKQIVPKVLLLTLYSVGIVLTFHRMSWIVCVVIIIIYLWVSRKVSIKKGVAIVGCLSVAGFFTIKSFPSLFTNVDDSPFVQQRLLSDTVTGRFIFYNIAIENISKNLLIGIGGPKSDIYYRGVMRAGGREDEASGEVGGIHNLFLLMAFFYGIPVFIIFTLFLIALMIFLSKKIANVNIKYLLPLLIVVMYFLANLSNMFPVSTEIGFLMAIFAGFGAAMYVRGSDIMASRFDEVNNV